MADFFEFFFYLISYIVRFLLSISLGLGFSYGDAMIGLSILSVLVSALVIRYNREKIR